MAVIILHSDNTLCTTPCSTQSVSMGQVECEISPLVSYCGEVSSVEYDTICVPLWMCMSLFMSHCVCVCYYLCPTVDVDVTVYVPLCMFHALFVTRLNYNISTMFILPMVT